MADGSFFAETEALQERVGDGIIDASVTVDQVYALYQHEGADFNHPRGGEAFYLRKPLFDRAEDYLGRMAGVLEGDATTREVFIGIADDLADAIPVHAPVEFNVLRQSAEPVVEDDGAEIYRRLALIGRLTQEELNAIRAAEEPIVNPQEWLRQWHFRRGEGGHPRHPGDRAL